MPLYLKAGRGRVTALDDAKASECTHAIIGLTTILSLHMRVIATHAISFTSRFAPRCKDKSINTKPVTNIKTNKYIRSACQ